ncbi:hypothetical protein [Thiobacillus sp.]|uniref:hypothetical protein n=1 Tax=Thiobacillus sp. TaxID=924 RepID=UPI0011D909A1|nr:hypothetical protein [Thiobacillus sp.]TXH73964.1 MAG: hypothetical protein E6Q82_12000 [Thiobacillus sp.]
MNLFEAKLNGTLYGLMRWQDWDALRVRLGNDPGYRWYAYAVGSELPHETLGTNALLVLLNEIDALLRRDHTEDYLGIVYVDNPDHPSLIKIYDPNNLGASCGSIGFKVPPGWVLSLDRPIPLEAATPLPGNRRRWWDALRARLISA